MFQSIDGGATWVTINVGLTNTFVETLTISASGDLYAGTGGDGVFKFNMDK